MDQRYLHLPGAVSAHKQGGKVLFFMPQLTSSPGKCFLREGVQEQFRNEMHSPTNKQ